MTAEVVTLRMALGPRDDWFTPAAVEQLFAGEYAVSPAADRSALRLEGAALERRHDDELASEGLVTGAVRYPRPVSRWSSSPTIRSPAATRSPVSSTGLPSSAARSSDRGTG